MKNFIEQEIIDKLPCIHIDGISDNENEFVNSWIKYLLQYAKDFNNSNEMGVILDKTDWNNADIVLGHENHVTFNTDKMKKWFDEGYNNLRLIHNHPSNNIFSERDIFNFCKTEAINTMIVIGNKGTIYLIQKLEGFDKYKLIQYYSEAKMHDKNKLSNNKILELTVREYQSILSIRFVKEEVKC